MMPVFQENSQRSRRRLDWIMLCLTLVFVVGCQAMLRDKARLKSASSENRFSCGEPLPGAVR